MSYGVSGRWVLPPSSPPAGFWDVEGAVLAGGTPSSGPESWERGVGQALGTQPKLHMGLAVLAAPLEPVGFAWEQRGAGWRRVCVWGEDQGQGALHLLQPLQRLNGAREKTLIQTRVLHS